MSRIQLNKQGFYPVIKPVDEDTYIVRTGNKAFKVITPSNCKITIYLDDNELYTTQENVIDISDLEDNYLQDKKITVSISKYIFGYTTKAITKEIQFELSCCSENDDVLIVCSENLICN